MRLPYQIRNRVNKSPRFQEHSPPDWSQRADWSEENGKWSCSQGRYLVVEDPKFGLVIAERRNVTYSSSTSL